MAFAAIGAALEEEVLEASVGAAAGVIPASVGDLAGDGVGDLAGALSGIGRLIGITHGGIGMDITTFLTRMRILTRSYLINRFWEGHGFSRAARSQ